MNKDDRFYIGWQEKMGDEHRRFLRKRIILFFALIPVFVFLLVFFQKGFNTHSFQLGKTSQISGLYYNIPYPMLIADEGQLPEGISNEILLVGFGKVGANATMNKIQERTGSLHRKKIVLAGTLIKGDGKTLMELTQKDDSLIQQLEATSKKEINLTPKEFISVKGEILDPKCYFGVMKPGEGKIHKSCAIRCISGGIPPVFRYEPEDNNQDYKYYLMLDKQGSPLNKETLKYVAEKVSVTGTTNKFSSWDILYLDINDIKMKYE